MGLFCFAVVWCLSAHLYMSCVFRGSFVSSLFWLFIKLFFIDQKKKISQTKYILDILKEIGMLELNCKL